jgi:hypothetical protein
LSSHSIDHGTMVFLLTKRQIRPPKASYPCRCRKVRCDFNTPYESCIRRGHLELCGRKVTVVGLYSQVSRARLVHQHLTVSTNEKRGLDKPRERRNGGFFVDSPPPNVSELHLMPISLPNSLISQHEEVRDVLQGQTLKLLPGVSLGTQNISEFV